MFAACIGRAVAALRGEADEASYVTLYAFAHHAPAALVRRGVHGADIECADEARIDHLPHWHMAGKTIAQCIGPARRRFIDLRL